MAMLRTAQPLWIDRTPPHEVPHYPPLIDHQKCDVAIVGGGITGATIACLLTEHGFSVAVLEGRQIGRGSTVASTALLMQEPDADLAELTRQYGEPVAQRLWEVSREANDGLLALIERHRIPCELTRRDSVYFTLDQHVRLRREYDLRRKARLQCRWVDRSRLRQIAGIPGSAIRTSGNAQADPYKMCVGLFKAAEYDGARIFEHSPVATVARTQGQMLVRTPRGSVRARSVVVATGFATPEFKSLAARFRMRHTYVLVTEPLSSRDRRRLRLNDVMLWDTDRPYHYARWTTDHRLMLGGGDRPRVHGAKRRRALRSGLADVRNYFVTLYPALDNVRVDYAWEGLFATTPDGLPYIGPHRRYPGHLFALGYGGNGVTFSFLAGRLIRERLQGRITPDHTLFAFGRTR